MRQGLPEIHPLAELIPVMDEEEFRSLVNDIRENGQREPITLYEGKILDGRHRARACAELGLTPIFRAYDGDRPATYVVSLNVKRRQLEKSVLAVIALEFLPHLKAEARERQREGGAEGGKRSHGSEGVGRPTQTLTEPRDTLRARDEAGKMVGVSGELVGVADRVRRERPDLYEEVKSGERTLTSAATEIREKTIGTRERQISNKANERFTSILGSLSAITATLPKINLDRVLATSRASDLPQYAEIIRAAESALRKARSYFEQHKEVKR